MLYIGIDVGGTNLVAGLVNELGHIFNQVTTPVAKDMTAEQFGGELVRMARRLCEVGEIAPDQVEAVGNVDDGTAYPETMVIYKDAAFEIAAKAVVSDLSAGRVVNGGDFYQFDTDLLVIIGQDWIG